MEQKSITRAEAVNEIRKSHGQFFWLTFVKKDMTIRRMTARLGVKSYLKGSGKKPTTWHIPKYITVFDIVKQGYRNVNVNTIMSLSIKGSTYIVN